MIGLGFLVDVGVSFVCCALCTLMSFCLFFWGFVGFRFSSVFLHWRIGFMDSPDLRCASCRGVPLPGNVRRQGAIGVQNDRLVEGCFGMLGLFTPTFFEKPTPFVKDMERLSQFCLN